MLGIWRYIRQRFTGGNGNCPEFACITILSSDSKAAAKIKISYYVVNYYKCALY